MSEAFSTSGESSDITAGPAPQLQGLFIPGIDNSQFIDGFGMVTPWGGGSTARRYGDYGISAEVSKQSTQLNDLATGFIPGGATYNLEGFVGPQGPVGPPGPPGLPGIGLTSLPFGYVLPVNSNYLVALPHNLDLINDLGTTANKLIYTDSYSTVTTIAGVDLCSGTTDGNTLSESPTYEEREITFDTPVEITSGKTYAITANAASRTEGAEVHWAARIDNPYVNGSRYASSNSGISWSITSNVDLWFKTKANGVVKEDGSLIEVGDFFLYGANWSAQTFIASSTYTISSVVLKLHKLISGGGEPGTVTVSIRAVNSYSEATWAESTLTSAGRAILDDANAATQATTLGLGTGDAVTHDTLTLSAIAAEATDVDKFLVDSTGVIKYRTGTQVLSDIGASASGHDHSGVYEPADVELSSLAALSYVAASFVKMTGVNTFALRTLQQTSDDLEATIDHNNLLNFTVNEHYLQSAITEVGTIATGVWEGTDVAVAHGGTGASTAANARTSLGLGTTDSPTFAKLTVQDTTIETTLGYIGFYNDHRKTAGVTDHLDYFYGHQNYIVYNQTGGIIGTSCAFYNQFSLVDGDIGDVSNPKNLNGVYSFVDLNAGKVYGNVFGFQTVIDQEAANEVTGNIYGNYVDIDADGTVGGSVYGLYFNEGSNVDYGIYQNGTAPNLFGGAVSITGNLTMTGNIIIPGDGTIGQAAGPLLTFDDTNDHLHITGCKVGIGGTHTPGQALDVRSTSSLFGDGRYNMFFFDNTAMAAGVGAGMVFGGCYTAAGAQTSFAIIWGEKENANEADFAGQMHLGTRVAAGSVSSDLIINSLGNVDIPGDFTAGTIQADDGFTGTGAYTNFTIVGGIITAAT